jgi:hypothetical protein
MSKKNEQDLADKALAEEFGLYISSVAREIVSPIQASTSDADKSIKKVTADTEKTLVTLIRSHQEEYSTKTIELIECLEGLGRGMHEAVAVVAEGHEETRQRLIAYATLQSEEARDEMAKQSALLGESFQAQVMPQLDSLTEPVTTLINDLKIQNEKYSSRVEKFMVDFIVKNERQFRWLQIITISLLVIQATAIAALLYWRN